MKWKWPKLTLVRLMLFVVITPTVVVFLAIATIHNDAWEYKVTHEVYFEVESDGKPLGMFVLGLFGETVPTTVKNFITFSTKGYNGYSYEGTTFHRVMKKFMMQGGDVISDDGKGSISIYGSTFPDENFEIKHSSPGFLSMANKGKDTNGCQFFITTVATPWLNGHHVVFGKVIEGIDLIHIIESMPTDWDHKPLKDITIAKSGQRLVAEPYFITDDPYNLYNWLKTMTLPLASSFAVIYFFSYFAGILDKCILDSDSPAILDEQPEETQPKKDEVLKVKGEEMKSLLEGQEKEEVEKGEERGEGKKEKGKEKEKGNMEVRKRLTVAKGKRNE